MAAYRRVYDSRHLQLTAKNRDQLRNPTLCNRVWATFTFFKVKSCKEAYTDIAVRVYIATPLRELTCHMGSHSVTCHSKEVTFTPLPEPKLVLDIAPRAELT